MPRKPDPNFKEISDVIYVGEDKDKNLVGIEEPSLLANGLLIIGAKNSGKEAILKKIAYYQDFAPYTDTDGVYKLPNSRSCATYILSKPGESYYFYAIPKKWKRVEHIHLVTPSTDMKVRNELLGMKDFDYDKVNKILDFTKLCDNRGIAVIDMENYRYEEASLRAVGMLLLNLQVSMHDTNNTKLRRHYLMIDDAWHYLPYLESILKYGPSYNVSTILAFDSRSQYKEYETLIETNIQNVLIMGNLRYEDAKYFSERFEIPLKELLEGGRDHFYLASYDKDMHFKVTKCFINETPISAKDDELLVSLARRYKRELMKASADEEYVKDIMLAYAKCIAEQNRDFEIGTAFDSMQRVAKELDSKEQAKTAEVKAHEVPSAQPATQKEEPVAPEPSETDQEPVQIIGAVKKTPVTAPTTPLKQSSKQSSGVEGLKALMGIVDNAPPRIQKQLKDEGFPVKETAEKVDKVTRPENVKSEEPAKETPQNNSDTTAVSETAKQDNKEPAQNPSTNKKKDNLSKIQNMRERARSFDMPTYTSSQTFAQKQKSEGRDWNTNHKGETQKHPNQQNATKPASKKQNKNDKNNKKPNEKPQNASHKNQPNQNAKSTRNKNVNKTQRPVSDGVDKKPKNVKEDSVKKEPKVITQTPKVSEEEVVEKYTNPTIEPVSESTKIDKPSIAVEDIVVVEETTSTETPSTNEMTKDKRSGVNQVENQAQEAEKSESISNTSDESLAVSTQDSQDNTESDNENEEVLDLFGGDRDEDKGLFDEDDEEDIEMSKNGLRNDNFGNVGLSDRLATLSVQPRSSGETFSKDESSATELIDRLKERGNNTNFFSKRKEIELLKRNGSR